MQYFEKIAKADLFIFLDDVQFSNNNFQHYNYIDGNCVEGKVKLKLPVQYHFGDLIKDISIKNTDWFARHINIIRQVYRGAPFCEEVVNFLVKTGVGAMHNMSDISCKIIKDAIARFGINTPIIKASELNVSGKKQERVINLCKAVGATTYLSGNGASAYQSEQAFNGAGLNLVYNHGSQDFNNFSFVDRVAKYGFGGVKLQ